MAFTNSMPVGNLKGLLAPAPRIKTVGSFIIVRALLGRVGDYSGRRTILLQKVLDSLLQEIVEAAALFCGKDLEPLEKGVASCISRFSQFQGITVCSTHNAKPRSRFE